MNNLTAPETCVCYLVNGFVTTSVNDDSASVGDLVLVVEFYERLEQPIGAVFLETTGKMAAIPNTIQE